MAEERSGSDRLRQLKNEAKDLYSKDHSYRPPEKSRPGSSPPNRNVRRDRSYLIADIQTKSGRRQLERWLDQCKREGLPRILGVSEGTAARVIIDLPDRKRFTAVGRYELFTSPVLLRLRQHRGTFCNGAYFEFPGIPEADLRPFLEEVLRIVDRDFQPSRRELARASSPRDLTNRLVHDHQQGHLRLLGTNLPDLVPWPSDSEIPLCGTCEGHEVDVWRLVLEDHVEWDRYPCRVIQDVSVAFPGHDQDGQGSFDWLLSRLSSLEAETARDFLARNKELCRIEPESLAATGFSLIEVRGEWMGWSEFHHQYPNAQGLLACSRVGFNETAGQALVALRNLTDDRLLEHSNSDASTWSFLRYYVLERLEDSWEVAEELKLDGWLAHRLIDA